jgi:predicted ATPase
MLEKLRISNFKGLRSVYVPLRPLTVLVGKNDTGKTTFLRAIDAVANGTAILASDKYNNIQELSGFIEGTIAKGRTAKVTTNGQPDKQESICPACFYQPPVEGALMVSDGYPDHLGAPPLQSNGKGVPSLIDYLLRRDRDRFDELVEVIKDHVPGVKNIQIATPEPALRRLDLLLENGLSLPANEASSGIRLLLFFIALTYHPSPPKIVLIEEPETGLHPKRLADVVRFLREITQGKHATQPTQVVLSTHSPYLLDLVNPLEDQVLVFQRGVNGERTVAPADVKRLGLFLDEFMLGEVWYNQGEEGMVSK